MKKNLGVNVIFQTLYQIFLTLTPLITTPYVSRVLGVEGVGTYSYTLSVSKYFMLFAMLGVADYGCRSIASVRDDKGELSKEFSNIFLLQFISSFLSITVYFLYCFFIVKTDFNIALLQGMMVISCAFDISWFFFGIEKIGVTVTRGVLIKIVTMVFTFTIVNKNTGVAAYTIAMAGGLLVSQLSLWLCIKKEINFVKPTWNEMIKHIKPNLVLFVPVIAQSVFQLMDKSMLGWFSTKSQSGYYYNVDMIVNIPEGIIGGFGTVFFARLSALYADSNYNEINNVLNQSIELYTCVASALVFGIDGIIKEFVPLFFGKEFIPCIYLTYMLSPVILIKAYSTLLKYEVFIPCNSEKYYTFSVIVAAIINCFVNGFLIPIYGAAGAIIGTIAAELGELIVLIYGFKRINLNFSFNAIKSYSIYYVFALIMFGGVRLVSVINVSIIFKVVLEVLTGVIIYSCLCLMYWKYHKSSVLDVFSGMIKKGDNK